MLRLRIKLLLNLNILKPCMRSSIPTQQVTMAYPPKVMAYFRGKNKIEIREMRGTTMGKTGLRAETPFGK